MPFSITGCLGVEQHLILTDVELPLSLRGWRAGNLAFHLKQATISDSPPSQPN
jgi:hypothetical protein